MGFGAGGLAQGPVAQIRAPAGAGDGPAQHLRQDQPAVRRPVGGGRGAAADRRAGRVLQRRVGVGDVAPEQREQVLAVGVGPRRRPRAGRADRAVVHHHPAVVGRAAEGRLDVAGRRYAGQAADGGPGERRAEQTDLGPGAVAGVAQPDLAGRLVAPEHERIGRVRRARPVVPGGDRLKAGVDPRPVAGAGDVGDGAEVGRLRHRLPPAAVERPPPGGDRRLGPGRQVEARAPARRPRRTRPAPRPGPAPRARRRPAARSRPAGSSRR